ncbi:MAG: DedA family protein [Candidatus Methylacidiphilales bacterium]
MNSFWDLFKPQELIEFGGFALVLVIIFLENGVFFGFFLPGDSLLFTAGLLCTTILKLTLSKLIIGIALAAIAGYYFGYWFGWKTGDNIYKRKESIFFKKKYIETAETFYKKYGGIALILGRFLPIVRTFAPILAGIVRVNPFIFFIYTVIGAILWPIVICGAGFYVGQIFPQAIDYLNYIIIGFIVVTSIPVIKSLTKKKNVE